YTMDYHISTRPDELGKDQFERLLNLTSNVRSWIGYLVYSSLYKTCQLVDSLVDSLNRSNLVPCALAARSLLEYAATVVYYADQIGELAEQAEMARVHAELDRVVGHLVEIWRVCLAYSQRTRFNWGDYVRGNLD